ncbi:hypothetical protein, partial [Bacillus cereus]|uniref:hypothetical protein n=1 Tax=Bacillus cereus TaxID=1396 RepID=UPI0011555812
TCIIVYHGKHPFYIDYTKYFRQVLRLLAHYKLPNKKQRRLIENRFVCLNALFKKEGESSGN